MIVHVLADSDTRWKWGAGLAQALAPHAEIHAHLLNGRSTPTRRQLEEVGIPAASYQVTTLAEFASDPRVADGDAVVLGSVGGSTQAALHALAYAWYGARRRPVVITGYVGVVYEKVTDGLLLRAGADVVLANSPFDRHRFREIYAGLGISPDCVVQTALPFLSSRPYDPTRQAADHPFTVCFAVQPSVPETKDSRLYLLRRAVEHARKRPGRDVLIKLRSKPGEQTTHIEAYHYQTLAEGLGEPLPPNLHFSYGNMSDVLDRTDLLVTVSSTAALEAMQRGIPTALLSDLGVREEHGNHYFTGSGCVASWNDLDDGALPVANWEWLLTQGIISGAPYDELRSRIHQLRAHPRTPLRPYYTMDNAPGYLPGLLSRRGLKTDGSPLPGYTQSGRNGQGVVKRSAKKALRAMYRVGTQRVAPKIQRWGGL